MLAAGALACGEDRPRPGPPDLSIQFQRDSLNSPDTLRGTIQATDNEGIDSVWLNVGTRDSAAADGGFQLSFSAPFLFFIDSGLIKGAKVPVEFRARDIAGYTDVLDTFVVIK